MVNSIPAAARSHDPELQTTAPARQRCSRKVGTTVSRPNVPDTKVELGEHLVQTLRRTRRRSDVLEGCFHAAGLKP